MRRGLNSESDPERKGKLSLTTYVREKRVYVCQLANLNSEPEITERKVYVYKPTC